MLACEVLILSSRRPTGVAATGAHDPVWVLVSEMSFGVLLPCETGITNVARALWQIYLYGTAGELSRGDEWLNGAPQWPMVIHSIRFS